MALVYTTWREYLVHSCSLRIFINTVIRQHVKLYLLILVTLIKWTAETSDVHLSLMCCSKTGCHNKKRNPRDSAKQSPSSITVHFSKILAFFMKSKTKHLQSIRCGKGVFEPSLHLHKCLAFTHMCYHFQTVVLRHYAEYWPFLTWAKTY